MMGKTEKQKDRIKRIMYVIIYSMGLISSLAEYFGYLESGLYMVMIHLSLVCMLLGKITAMHKKYKLSFAIVHIYFILMCVCFYYAQYWQDYVTFFINIGITIEMAINGRIQIEREVK